MTPSTPPTPIEQTADRQPLADERLEAGQNELQRHGALAQRTLGVFRRRAALRNALRRGSVRQHPVAPLARQTSHHLHQRVGRQDLRTVLRHDPHAGNRLRRELHMASGKTIGPEDEGDESL